MEELTGEPLKSWRRSATLEYQISESEAVMQLTISELCSSVCLFVFFSGAHSECRGRRGNRSQISLRQTQLWNRETPQKKPCTVSSVFYLMGFDVNVLLFPFASYLFNIV